MKRVAVSTVALLFFLAANAVALADPDTVLIQSTSDQPAPESKGNPALGSDGYDVYINALQIIQKMLLHSKIEDEMHVKAKALTRQGMGRYIVFDAVTEPLPGAAGVEGIATTSVRVLGHGNSYVDALKDAETADRSDEVNAQQVQRIIYDSESPKTGIQQTRDREQQEAALRAQTARENEEKQRHEEELARIASEKKQADERKKAEEIENNRHKDEIANEIRERLTRDRLEEERKADQERAELLAEAQQKGNTGFMTPDAAANCRGRRCLSAVFVDTTDSGKPVGIFTFNNSSFANFSTLRGARLLCCNLALKQN